MKRILTICFFLVLHHIIWAQGDFEKKRFMKEKFFFGGGLGLQFGSYSGIEVAPIVGYKPIKHLYTGLRFSYQYYGGSRVNFDTHVGSGSIFAQYILFNTVITHVELEEAYVSFNDFGLFPYNDEYWGFSPLVGGGIYQKMGDRSGLMLLILFNLNNTPKSMYINPIIRLSFVI